MMRLRTLYPGLLLLVLLLAACGSKDTPDRPAPADNTEVDVPHPNPPRVETSDASIRVVVLGNSLAAGYGLDPDQSFPALLQQRADSLGWPVEVVNAGVSGETTAGGLSRIDWLLREPLDVLVLELGGNDGLRGIDPEVTRQNLQGIIDKTSARYPEARIILAGMQVPPNLGQQYTSRFRAIYPELAATNDIELIPFLLENVGGDPRLNQSDGIHPTAEGHRIVAETVWRTLKPVLEPLVTESKPV